jgi:hypothetical protein
MLNLNMLLAPGESAAALEALRQDWIDTCQPSTPLELLHLNDAICFEWLYLRADRMYRAVRDTFNLETDPISLGRLMRRRNELKRRVEAYKRTHGYTVRKVKLRRQMQAFTQTEDFDDIQLDQIQQPGVNAANSSN